jgi:hypothetical protein
MAYIYTAKDILEFDKIRDKMVASFKRLGEDEIGNSKTRTKAE